MQIKQYQFKATLIPSLITVALLYIMISLGFWQLDRAEYKANIQSLIESKQGTATISLDSIEKQEENWLYQPVFVSGKFDLQHQIYLDNQVNNMLAGYSVFTPLKISDDLAILVNRGWLPVGNSRANLPDISVTSEMLRIDGLLSHAPSKTLLLSDNVNSYLQWPAVLQYVDIIEIEKQLEYKLLPMIIIMDQSTQTKLQPLPVKINMRSEKHTAYAFQWFGLSLTLLIIYIVVNTKNTNKI
ncbi:MAG: SURF1 family protein [Gammaproteobacteria bacterium]|nr:SURF1 family protein [Gammaproteobacteria bacterium]